MIGGLDVYIRNSIVYNTNRDEYIIVHGNEDNSLPVYKNDIPVKEYALPLYRNINIFYDFKVLIATILIVCKEKPDIIHCHSAKGGIIGRMAGFLTKTKTIYTPHAFSFLSTPSKLKRIIYLAIERLTRLNTYILACSDSEREIAIKTVHYKDNHAFVWHNSVPDAYLEKGEKVISNQQYACYVGRPCYQKNPSLLLDIVKELKLRGLNLKFFLLGVGYHSPELNKIKSRIEAEQLQNYIELKPWISHADCQEYVRNSIFYISTSLYEGLPLSIIEAMANGKVIIASNVVGNIDCVENDSNGWLLPLDPVCFVDKIICLLSNPILRKKMEIKSRQIFLDKFLINNQIQYLQSIYKKIDSL